MIKCYVWCHKIQRRDINLSYVEASRKGLKFELHFEGWAGSTTAVMKSCLYPPAHAQMAEGEKYLCAASFSYCSLGESACVPYTDTSLLHLGFGPGYLPWQNWPEVGSQNSSLLLSKYTPTIPCPANPQQPVTFLSRPTPRARNSPHPGFFPHD